MMDEVILRSCLVLGGLGLFFGLFLGVASKKFSVKLDPAIEKIAGLLPGANCGACGLAGCRAMAELLKKGEAALSICAALPEKEAEEIAGILGVAVTKRISQIAAVHCCGGGNEAGLKFDYDGLADCRASILVGNSPKACDYGCIGFGDCARACPFEAISMDKNNLPIIDVKACTGCGKCVTACPRKMISLIPRQNRIYLGCSSQDRGKAVKEVCSVGCIACGLCAKPDITPSGVIKMKGNLPEINYEKAEDISEAAAKCPTHSFVTR